MVSDAATFSGVLLRFRGIQIQVQDCSKISIRLLGAECINLLELVTFYPCVYNDVVQQASHILLEAGSCIFNSMSSVSANMPHSSHRPSICLDSDLWF